MREMKWFRFYNETIDDEKIHDIAQKENQPFPFVLGIWACLLTLASRSSQRGYLYIYGKKPYTVGKLSTKLKTNPTILDVLVKDFIDAEMIDLQGLVLHITHWEDRQFESDNVAERVARYRMKKRNVTATNA